MSYSTKKSLTIGSIVFAVLSTALGGILHFIYEWCPNGFFAVIGAINESVWEHLKLLFWSMLLLALPEYLIYGRKARGFLAIRAFAMSIGMLVIVALFYSYTGIVGNNVLWMDILTFIIGIITAYVFSWRKLTSDCDKLKGVAAHIIGILLVTAIAICFAVFTFMPPHIPLFLDTAANAYGITK